MAIAASAPAQQRGGTPISESAFIAQWKALSTDQARLSELGLNAPLGQGGLRALQQIASDTSNSRMSRVTAIWSMSTYLDPESRCPRDTLRAVEAGLCSGASHSDYRRSSSIEPSQRDSVFATLQQIAAIERGGLSNAAFNTLHGALPFGKLDRLSTEARLFCEGFSRAALVSLGRDYRATMAGGEFARITSCPTDGPPAIARAWELVPDSADATYFLRVYTSRLSDKRLFDATLKVASDEARPMNVRIAALNAAGTQLHPRMHWYDRQSRIASDSRVRCGEWGMYWHDAVQIAGAIPMEGATRTQALMELEKLEATTRSAIVREDAYFIRSCVLTLFSSPSR